VEKLGRGAWQCCRRTSRLARINHQAFLKVAFNATLYNVQYAGVKLMSVINKYTF